MVCPAGSPADEMILLLRRGNEKGLAFIFSRFYTALHYFACQLLQKYAPGASFTADDIVAESFIKLWHSRQEFEHISAVKTFLYVTVKNSCINQLKQIHCHAAHHEEIEYLSEKTEKFFAEHALIKSELLREIWANVEQLPPVRRRIFKMIYSDGLKNREIAKKLNISADTVRVQKARALQTLRAVIKPLLS